MPPTPDRIPEIAQPLFPGGFAERAPGTPVPGELLGIGNPRLKDPMLNPSPMHCILQLLEGAAPPETMKLLGRLGSLIGGGVEFEKR
jgi:hypothetical protein